jgi:hypothetical protein
MQLKKIAIWVVALFLAFVFGVEVEEPRLAAPLAIDFYSLVTNQDYLVGARPRP